MKIAAFAILVGCRSNAAFNINLLLRDVDVPSRTSYTNIHSLNFNSRGLPSSNSLLQMRQSPDDSTELSASSEPSVDTSRRAALRRCASIFTSSALAWNQCREASYASEFSDGMVETQEERPPIPTDGPPQFSDETVITPIRPQVVQQQASSATYQLPVKQVTLENNQVVTIPVKQTPVLWSAEPSKTELSEQSPTEPVQQTDLIGLTPEKPEQRKNSLTAELGITGVVLGGIAVAVGGRGTPASKNEIGSGVAKVVMITNEPYGLDTGRRFYKGVDITVNDPIPASDIREYCEAGKVNEDCTETIAGFLGEVQSNSQKAESGEPSIGQKETATAVISYLDSLSHNNMDSAESKRSMAFSSYLNILSNGQVNAPSSSQLVADYLSSLSDMQGRMNALEQSMHKMPDEISGRLQSWQEGQDEKLAREFLKIEEFLMKNENNNAINGGSNVPSVDMNGNISQVQDMESSFS